MNADTSNWGKMQMSSFNSNDLAQNMHNMASKAKNMAKTARNTVAQASTGDYSFSVSGGAMAM